MDDYELGFRRALDEVETEVGLDVGRYRETVRAFVYGRFLGRLSSAGVDPKDAIGEILMGLVIRNRGMCPWRPGGRSRASYVFMVTECVISNLVRKRMFRLKHELHTLASYFEANLGAGLVSQEVGSAVPLQEEDVHHYLVEQRPAPTVVDGVLLDDLDREFADEPDVRAYVRCCVEGAKRMDIWRSGITQRRIAEIQRSLRRFLTAS